MKLEYSKDFYEENGFVVIKNAVEEEYIDRYLQVMEKNIEVDELGALRAWDGYTNYLDHPESLDILCHESLQNGLELIDKGVALHMELPYLTSTRKGWHQDSGGLANSIAGENYIGIWVALEDVHPDSGPFELIPGSHKWDIDAEYTHLASDQNKDLVPNHEKIQLIADKRNLEEIYSFLPKKGDAIIWHGRLIHRGANPRNNDLTRKSLIGHYCNMFAHEAAVENAPNVFDTIKLMFNRTDDQYARWKNGGYYFTNPESK